MEKTRKTKVKKTNVKISKKEATEINHKPFLVSVFIYIPLIYYEVLISFYKISKQIIKKCVRAGQTYREHLEASINSSKAGVARAGKEVFKFSGFPRRGGGMTKLHHSESGKQLKNLDRSAIVISNIVRNPFLHFSFLIKRFLHFAHFSLNKGISPLASLGRNDKAKAQVGNHILSLTHYSYVIPAPCLPAGRKAGIQKIKNDFLSLLKKEIKIPNLNFHLSKKMKIDSPIKSGNDIISRITHIEFRMRIFSIKTFVTIILLSSTYLISLLYLAVLKDVPSSAKLDSYEPRLTTTIYDRKGNILYRLYNDQDRTLVSVDQISPDLINATLAIEDQTFYTHKGLSLKGIARAVKRTFIESDLQGGSTITQQLIKNTLLSPERTAERKIKEAVLAVEIERRFSKNEILQMYLNTISYGGTTYGIKSASNKYFGKEPIDLSLAESSFLAGLPVAPSTYSPYNNELEVGKARQKEVLRRMVELNFITPLESEKAFGEQLEFKQNQEIMKAPHFVNFVISELEKRYGYKLIAEGGLDIFTSLDLEMQDKLQEIVATQTESLKRYNVKNGAALITNPKTGEILAMVGSKSFWDDKNDGKVNVTTAPRQPGSSIKPITYSLALENGYTLSTVLNDSPITFANKGSRPYSPVNYDGNFHGQVTLASALANSYNVPAVKVLNSLGVDKMIEHAQKMGITTWDNPERFGLSLTLGAGEVKMTDMAVVYGIFANNGEKKELNSILKIYDPYGEILEENHCVDFMKEPPSILTRKLFLESKARASDSIRETYAMSDVNEVDSTACKKERVVSDSTAYLISYILSDNRLRTPAFGANSSLNVTKKQFAVKTGTTSNLKDNWAIGYNNDYVVVTWIGNNHGEQMNGVVSGYHGSTEIWKKAVDYLIANKDLQDKFDRPSSIIEVEICPLTNTLGCASCPNVTQIFTKGKEPKIKCDSDVVRKIIEDRKKAEEKKKEDKKDDDNEE